MPNRTKKNLLLAAALGVVLVGGLLAAAVFFGLSPFLGACNDEEKAVFAEFPQYGGVRPDPEAFPESGGCATWLDTEDPKEAVRAYYDEQLTSHGWVLEKVPSEVAEQEVGGTIVYARRDGFAYEVSFENRRFYTPPRPGVHLAVHVWEG